VTGLHVPSPHFWSCKQVPRCKLSYEAMSAKQEALRSSAAVSAAMRWRAAPAAGARGGSERSAGARQDACKLLAAEVVVGCQPDLWLIHLEREAQAHGREEVLHERREQRPLIARQELLPNGVGDALRQACEQGHAPRVCTVLPSRRTAPTLETVRDGAPPQPLVDTSCSSSAANTQARSCACDAAAAVRLSWTSHWCRTSGAQLHSSGHPHPQAIEHALLLQGACHHLLWRSGGSVGCH